MEERKLKALGYTTTTVDFNNEKEFRQLIIWLEKHKLREAGKQYRAQLQNPQSPKWDGAFEQYKRDLQCPPTISSRITVVDWILGLAVRQNYGLNKDVHNKNIAKSDSMEENVPNVIADNPLDHLNYTCEEFTKGIKSVAALLNITPHPDPLVTLEACSKFVNKRLSIDVQSNPNEHIVTGAAFPYQTTDLGFDLGDRMLNEAAKLLRLLYIQDLRDLQTKVNECIVAVQNVTANPKTDARLGKVGR